MRPTTQGKAQHLLLLEVELVEEIAQSVHQGRTGAAQRVQVGLVVGQQGGAIQILTGQGAQPRRIAQPGTQRTALGGQLAQQAGQPLLLGGVQIQLTAQAQQQALQRRPQPASPQILSRAEARASKVVRLQRIRALRMAMVVGGEGMGVVRDVMGVVAAVVGSQAVDEEHDGVGGRAAFLCG